MRTDGTDPEKENSMYGTIAKLKVKQGMEEAAMQDMDREITADDFVGNFVYRMDDDPNEFYLVVMFESKASYHANAERPETNADYERMLAYLDGEPEWHDGEIIHKEGV